MKYHIKTRENEGEGLAILDFDVFFVSKGIFLIRVAFNQRTEFECEATGEKPGWTELMFSDTFPNGELDETTRVSVEFHHDQPGMLHGGMSTDTYWGMFFEMPEYMDRLDKRRVPMNNLTGGEVDILRQIRNGKDVPSRDEAQLLREIERKHPELVSISGPQNEYKDDERLPYLGAILTPVGIQVLQDLGVELEESFLNANNTSI